MRDLNVSRIELDEAWSFCFKKQVRLTPEDGTDKGDQYVPRNCRSCEGDPELSRRQTKPRAYIGLRCRFARASSWFSRDFIGWLELLSRRNRGRFRHRRDLRPNPKALRRTGGCCRGRASLFSGSGSSGKQGPCSRSSAPYLTSYVERQNLTLRMQQRRFSRLSNGFSKKLENHVAAVALYAAHYNLCRVHETLRVTPAMQLGVTDHIWSVGELVDAALAVVPTEPTDMASDRRRRFRVIEGGNQ
jgi:hypothetical protein